MKLKVNVYSEFNEKKEIEEYLAIKTDNVIKYIDFADNIMIIDMENDIIKRENKDYIFIMDFNNNVIDINSKHLKKSFTKEIKKIKLEKTAKSYLIRYQLLDENIINELYLKY